MKTRALNFNPLKIKAIYVSLLLVIGILMGLVSSCNQDNEPAPVPPPSPVVSDESKPPVPLVPIILDGIAAAPEELSKYGNQELIYMLDEKSVKEGVIRIFTDRLKADTYRQQVDAAAKLASPADKGGLTPSSARFTAEIRTFNEPNYLGYAHSFSLGETGLWDLSTFKFDCNWLGYNCHSINNQISSIKCVNMPHHWTILYRYPQYRGNQLWIPPGANRINLTTYAFNDYVSSIGFIPDSEMAPQ